MQQARARSTRRPAVNCRRGAAFVGLALAAALAGCAVTGRDPASSAVEPAAAAPFPATTAARSTVGRWRPGTVPGAAFTSRDRAAAARPVATTPIVDDDPSQLLGLNRIAIEKLLGQPRVVRRDAPAEIWQYQSAACVLDLFLYQNEGIYRVVYLEARTAAAQPAPIRGCLNAVLTARRWPTAS